MDGTSSAGALLGGAIRGLRDRRTWRATGYVITSFFARLGLFVVSVIMLAPSLVLSVVGIGIPLAVAAFAAVHWLIGFERRRARWVARPIGARPLRSGSLLSRFRDPVGWRHAGFAVTAWLVTALLFVALVVVWAVPVFLLSIPIWGWALDTPWTRLVAMPVLGAALLCVSPWAAQGIGWLCHKYVEAVVGPDRVAEMEQRVTEVTESRSEILHAVAGERRRIERNLHDGVQQQLIALGIDLGLAEAKLESDPESARLLLADATQKTRESIGELRSIGRGLHPAILGDRGFDAALSAVAANSAVPVELRLDLAVDPPPDVAEAAYFVVSEALANVMKHSGARLAVVEARTDPTALTLSIYDDGRGGANLSGTGLAGIAARVRGMNGSFELQSPPGGPTTLSATLAFGADR